MNKRNHGAGTLPIIALLLLVIAVAGGANYYRNWTAEQVDESMRPFSQYSDKDLENLGAAYQAEVDSWAARYDSAKSARRNTQSQGSMQGNIAQFERVRKASSQLKDLNTEIGQSEARLRDIERERDYRALQQDPSAHIRRLTSL